MFCVMMADSFFVLDRAKALLGLENPVPLLKTGFRTFFRQWMK